jgi:hypothetical protein
MVQRQFQCVSRLWLLIAGQGHVVAALHGVDASLMKNAPLRRFATVAVFGLYRDR